VRYGKNKAQEYFLQINLCLAFCYWKLAGHNPDVKTLKKLLADMNTIGHKMIKVVLAAGKRYYGYFSLVSNWVKNR